MASSHDSASQATSTSPSLAITSEIQVQNESASDTAYKQTVMDYEMASTYDQMSLKAAKAAEKLEDEAESLLSMASINEQDARSLEEDAVQGKASGFGETAVGTIRERSEEYLTLAVDKRSRARSKQRKADALRKDAERYLKHSEHGDGSGSVSLSHARVQLRVGKAALHQRW